MQTTTTLLMLSGGISSLAVLIDLLKQQDQKVYAHHVYLRAADYDSVAATQFCQQILDYCTIHYRAFSFSQSMLDHRDLSIAGIELTAIAYEAALAAKTFRDRDGANVDRCIFAGGLQSSQTSPPDKYIRQCFATGYYPESPPPLEKILVDPDIARAELPEVLLSLCALD